MYIEWMIEFKIYTNNNIIYWYIFPICTYISREVYYFKGSFLIVKKKKVLQRSIHLFNDHLKTKYIPLKNAECLMFWYFVKSGYLKEWLRMPLNYIISELEGPRPVIWCSLLQVPSHLETGILFGFSITEEVKRNLQN